ncbi:type IV pilin protein [Candidatus Avelusimicrobium facis]|uniref:type IV pilin protein n=1 Tax=Candidatus Avelusimicrobium facis TaxID=3416203 RepID=UPI003D13DBC6
MKNRFTGRLGRLFLNVVPLEGRSPGSVVTNKRNTADPGLKPFRMTSFYNGKKPGIFLGGFTLIELLVVVLIIGVLAAVALPQYRVAVERARVGKALPVLRSILDARERSFLANGTYSTDLEELDIAMSYTSKQAYEQGLEYTGTPIGYFRLPEGSSCIYASLGTVVIDFCPQRKSCYAGTQLGDRVCASFGPRTGTAENGHPRYQLNF